MEPSAADVGFMARALRLAERGLYTTDPNPRVGCVLVKQGRVIGEGFHARAGEPHAEVHALRQAGEQARGATVYVTLEPCSHHGRTPPCAHALIDAGVARVMVAMQDPNPLVAGSGLALLESAGIHTHVGLLRTEAEALNPGFCLRMRQGRPLMRVKLAMSLDGRTAMANGESQWITGAAARRDVQFLRARSSAVLTGRGTVLADDPGMNVRLDAQALGIEGAVRQPLRVVLDSALRTSTQSKIVALPGNLLIFHDDKLDAQAAVCALETVECQGVRRTGQGLDLHQVVQTLGARGINECHVEAGPTLCGALLQAELVDEIVVYLAPQVVMGDTARGLFTLPGLEHMADRIALRLKELRRVGEDIKLILAP